MSEPITDTERIDWLSGTLARAYGYEPGNFREHIDSQIEASRAAKALPPEEWIVLTDEFPVEEKPIVALASDGKTGVVSYCSQAGDWYMHYPGSDIHGLLWSEVMGPQSEIIKWRYGVQPEN